MILSMPGQAWLFLSTVIMGMAIGLFYDIFRIFRKVLPHAGWAVQLQDITFWAAATGGMFYFMLIRNFGEIRMFSLLGVAIGAVLYFLTLSKLILKVSIVVVNFLTKVIVTSVRIIIAPVRFAFNIIATPVKKIWSKQRKHLRLATKYGKMQVKKQMRGLQLLRKKI